MSEVTPHAEAVSVLAFTRCSLTLCALGMEMRENGRGEDMLGRLLESWQKQMRRVKLKQHRSESQKHW